MATRITSKPEYNGSGIYFKETDLTVVSSQTGGFSAGGIGLAEKGPAFEIISSSSFEERAFKLGDLNLNYPSSYYARQYLEQAKNYKEVRILGLEGYSDLKGFGIALNSNGNAAAVADTSPLTLVSDSLLCVLKERPTALTGRPAISSVTLQTTTYIDPVTGLSSTLANDYLFNLLITYVDSTTDNVVCSLRPESKDYIVKKMWNKPFEHGSKGEQTFPLIKNQICPLWVDFIIPSIKTKPDVTKSYGYYLPGSTTAVDYLPLLTGRINFGTNVSFDAQVITGVTAKTASSVTVGTKVTISGDVTTTWFNGAGEGYVLISGVTGTGTQSTVNGIWAVDNVVYNGGTTTTTFELYDYEDSVAAGTPTTPYTGISGTFSSSGSPRIAKYLVPTWEGQVLDFAGIPYQTPITPWFVSDGDANGDFKKLFRLQSISDGLSANTEIKAEIRNINPAGNNGKGTFDLVIREWSDRDDLIQTRLESFSNLTMDKKSDNYILRRIGDGEKYPNQSRYVVLELNSEEVLENDLLPYGCLGYPNIANNTFSGIAWTTNYDQSKPLAKQTLGLSNNKVNTFKEVAPDQLKFVNNKSTDYGIGFHLNPKNNAIFVNDQDGVFSFVDQSAYLTSAGKAILPTEKVRRSRFVVDFYGGFDGWNVYSERTWDDTQSLDYQALTYGIDLLGDNENINADFTVLTTPDFHLDTHPAACELVLDMVIKRGDCLYIPDLSYDETSDPQVASDLVLSSNIRSNATAVYFPWCQMEDVVNKENIWLPPSLLALGTITYVAQNENVWQPPGGSLRTVTNNLVKTRRRMKGDDREILKAATINPITVFPGSGYEITEVRTTQEVFSALSFIHNRLLLCYAKKTLNQTLRPLLFQLNGQITQDAFLSTVTPIFDRIKKLNGVAEYKVEVVDRPELNDRTTLYGRITIVPLYPVEKIVVEFTLQDSAFSYNQ